NMIAPNPMIATPIMTKPQYRIFSQSSGGASSCASMAKMFICISLPAITTRSIGRALLVGPLPEAPGTIHHDLSDGHAIDDHRNFLRPFHLFECRANHRVHLFFID